MLDVLDIQGIPYDSYLELALKALPEPNALWHIYLTAWVGYRLIAETDNRVWIYRGRLLWTILKDKT